MNAIPFRRMSDTHPTPLLSPPQGLVLLSRAIRTATKLPACFMVAHFNLETVNAFLLAFLPLPPGSSCTPVPDGSNIRCLPARTLQRKPYRNVLQRHWTEAELIIALSEKLAHIAPIETTRATIGLWRDACHLVVHDAKDPARAMSTTHSFRDLVHIRLALTPDSELPEVVAHFAEHQPEIMASCLLAGGTLITDFTATHIRPLVPNEETIARLLACSHPRIREVVTTHVIPTNAARRSHD